MSNVRPVCKLDAGEGAIFDSRHETEPFGLQSFCAQLLSPSSSPFFPQQFPWLGGARCSATSPVAW